MKIPSSFLVAAVAANIPFLMPDLSAQTEKFVPNYDESKIPAYVLPDPLEGVGTAEDWTKKRGEIYSLIEREMFGKAPKHNGDKIGFAEDVDAFEIMDGKARVSQPILKIAGQDVRLLMIQPAKAASAVPAVIGYNFGGNHTVMSDSRIVLGTVWERAGEEPRKAEDSERGKASSRWAIERIVDAGFALVTIYYGDVDPDFDDGFKNGIFAQFPAPKADEWGSIAGWAWSLSRVLDFLEQNDGGIDAKRVAVFGHSRLGKTSLWAGASDPRFALVISNDSGCGGAAL